MTVILKLFYPLCYHLILFFEKLESIVVLEQQNLSPEQRAKVKRAICLGALQVAFRSLSKNNNMDSCHILFLVVVGGFLAKNMLVLVEENLLVWDSYGFSITKLYIFKCYVLELNNIKWKLPRHSHENGGDCTKWVSPHSFSLVDTIKSLWLIVCNLTHIN